jgi:hypothetical protein
VGSNTFQQGNGSWRVTGLATEKSTSIRMMLVESTYLKLMRHWLLLDLEPPVLRL